MLWAVYKRRLYRTTKAQRAALYEAAIDLSRAYLILCKAARGPACGGVRPKATRRHRPAP